MELYKTLINESLDEDQKANREVVSRLKKNIKDNKDALQSNLDITKQQLSVVERLTNLLQKEINTIVVEFEKEYYRGADEGEEVDIGGYTGNLADMTMKYNNIVTFLKGINYNKLSRGSRSEVLSIVQRVLPSLKLLETYFNPENLGANDQQLEFLSSYIGTINEMYTQISDGTFNNIQILEKIPTKEEKRAKKEQVDFKLRENYYDTESVNRARKELENKVKKGTLTANQANGLYDEVVRRYQRQLRGQQVEEEEEEPEQEQEEEEGEEQEEEPEPAPQGAEGWDFDDLGLWAI
jgi:hypothetical protein